LWGTMLLQAAPSGIDGFDRKSLDLAQKSLSEAAKRAYFDMGRKVYRTLKADLELIAFTRIVQTINQTVDHLIATANTDDQDSLDFLEELARQFQAAPETGVPNAITAAKAAAHASDRATIIGALMDLRTQLWIAQQSWQQQLTDLATELSLFDSRFATNPDLI
jgi:hypothetical protein